VKEFFADKKFRGEALAVIETANEIIEDYQADGFDLTLRQLYYQFVSRGHIANNDKEYTRLGTIINDARLAGLVDWDAIKDRTRHIRERGCWKSPKDIVIGAARGYHLNRWNTQNMAVEVWIEKDALIGVIEDPCWELDVPCFSCRGYVSQSAMYEAGQRILKRDEEYCMDTVILHLGDHDPSGIDMTRDIQERLSMFTSFDIEVKRIALTMAQVTVLNPPPNPAKLTDSRSGMNKDGSIRPDSYIDNYGYESWELDAIEPRQLVKLVQDEVDQYIDDGAWKAVEEQEKEDRESIMKLAAGLRS